MNTKTQLHATGEYIVTEGDPGNSRAVVTLAPTANTLGPGQLLGALNSNGKFVPYNSAATDGSEVAAGILYQRADASSYDQKITVTVRDTTVDGRYLTGLNGAATVALRGRRIGVVNAQVGSSPDETQAAGGGPVSFANILGDPASNEALAAALSDAGGGGSSLPSPVAFVTSVRLNSNITMEKRVLTGALALTLDTTNTPVDGGQAKAVFQPDGTTVPSVPGDWVAFPGSQDYVQNALMEIYATYSGIYPDGIVRYGWLVGKSYSAGVTVPGAPTIALGSPTASTQPLTGTAGSTGGSAITDWIWEYKLSSSSTWLVYSDGTSATPSTTIPSLPASTSHDYRAKTRNAIGDSAYSATVTGSTAAVGGNPANDNVNRADGDLGVASGGAAYELVFSGASMQVVGNKIAQGSASGIQGNVIETGLVNRTMSFDFVTPASTAKPLVVILRFADESNLTYLGRRTDGEWFLNETVSGAANDFAGSDSFVPTVARSNAVNAVAVTMSGNDYSVSVNGSVVMTGTSAAAAGATKSGVFTYTDFVGQCADTVDNIVYS